MPGAFWLGLVLAQGPAPADAPRPDPYPDPDPAQGSAPERGADNGSQGRRDPHARKGGPRRRGSGTTSFRSAQRSRPRPLMLGLEGVGWVTPGLDVPRLSLDPRFVGRSTTPVGLGVFVRYDPNPLLTVELGTRSGSLRYRSRDGQPSQQVLFDFFMPSLAMMLWPLRAEKARFGLDAGVGGMYGIARYDTVDGRSRQTWGAFAMRAGADIEVGGPRLSLLFSFQGHAVVTPVDTATSDGPLFADSTPADRRAPVTRLATWVSGTIGLGYRF